MSMVHSRVLSIFQKTFSSQIESDLYENFNITCKAQVL